MRELTTSITTSSICEYLTKQLDTFFPDENNINKDSLSEIVNSAINNIEICFSKIVSPYYIKNNNSYFNHLNGDHYSSFLYQVSRSAYLNDKIDIATKTFLLNKLLFGIDVFYTVDLPKHYIFVHPIGTILGSGAIYSNYFVVYQGVTIGSNYEGIYPKFSNKTILFSNSSVIGNSVLGENFILGAKSSIINKDINQNKVVVGNFPNNKILNNENNGIFKYFSLEK
jgi:serine O-acetyltransferase